MRILYTTCIPSPYKVEFFNELSKYCDLTVVYERKSASDREASWKNEQKGIYKVIFLNGIKISNDSSISFGLINHLKKEKYDIIVFGVYHTITSMLTMQYLKNKGISFVMSSDGGFIKKGNFLKNKLKSHFISMASWYMSPGGETDDYLIKYGADKRKIYRYPFTSLSESDILEKIISNDEKRSFKKSLNIKEKKMIFSVGQMIHRKGFDILLKAFSEVHGDVGLYIAGGFPTDEYKDIIRRNNISNVHFVGFMSKRELSNYYKAADLFVLPTREDIWGLVIIEALGFGVPVITTNRCNAGLELIEKGVNGVIVSVESSKEISEAINKFLKKENEKIAKKCLTSVKEYTFENMVNKHLELFSKIMEE